MRSRRQHLAVVTTAAVPIRLGLAIPRPHTSHWQPAFMLAALLALAGWTTSVPAQSIGMVVDDNNAAVTVFDAATDTVIGTVPIGPGVHGDCAITMDGSLGFATDFNGGVWVIDLTTTPPSLAAGTNPIAISNFGEDLSLSPDGKFLVVVDGGAVQPISVIDIAARTEIHTFSLGADHNAVEVCDDGSVLVSSNNTGRVHRLSLNGAGTLTDTGELLFSPDHGFVVRPNNVFCAPNSTSGLAVRGAPAEIWSFTMPGLGLVDIRPLPGRLDGISGLVHPAGGRVYVRSNGNADGAVDVFTYNSATGALGDNPLLSIPIANTPPFFGMEQLALMPDGTKLYVTQPRAVNVYNASNGTLLRTMTASDIVQPTGICVAVAASKVTGGGQLTFRNGATANFGFVAQRQKDGLVSGQLHYFDHQSGLQISGPVEAITASDGAGAVTFSGTACAGACTFTVTVQDIAEPGTNKDTFAMTVSGSSTVQQSVSRRTISSGNIQKLF
jgi:hypothetical protein